ncbi:MAG: YkvA family protein [Armatimonadota bacterium]
MPRIRPGAGPLLRMNPLQLMRMARHLPNFIKLVWRLFTDKRVGILPRIVPVLAVVYFVFPLDFDWLIPLGYVDDILIAYLASKAFIWLCPKWVVQEHVRRIDAGG